MWAPEELPIYHWNIFPDRNTIKRHMKGRKYDYRSIQEIRALQAIFFEGNKDFFLLWSWRPRVTS
jgi:hypothetical protein